MPTSLNIQVLGKESSAAVMEFADGTRFNDGRQLNIDRKVRRLPEQDITLNLLVYPEEYQARERFGFSGFDAFVLYYDNRLSQETHGGLLSRHNRHWVESIEGDTVTFYHPCQDYDPYVAEAYIKVDKSKTPIVVVGVGEGDGAEAYAQQNGFHFLGNNVGVDDVFIPVAERVADARNAVAAYAFSSVINPTATETRLPPEVMLNIVSRLGVFSHAEEDTLLQRAQARTARSLEDPQTDDAERRPPRPCVIL